MKGLSLFVAALAATPVFGIKLPDFLKTSKSDSDPSESSESTSSASSGRKSLYPLERIQGVEYEPSLGKTGTTPGSRITKLRYGPYTVAAGELQNSPLPFNNLKVPCKNCYITAFQAGLEYADGTNANIHNGLWLHHMVLHDNKKKDVNCFYQTQRIFATGNERVTRRLNSHDNYGYYLGGSDTFSDVHELMSEAKESHTVYITMKYEWLPEDKATDYKKVTPIWLDVTGGCGLGDTPAKQGKYELSMRWTSTVSGPFIEAVGHVHDGGVDTKIYINDKLACTSEQVYGGKPEYIEPESVGAMAGMKHISQCGVCQNFANLEKGDKIRMVANYDANKHKQMKEGKGLMPVMGIVMGYVGN